MSVVELPSVFAIKVRTQFISREDAGIFLRQFREDIVARKLEVFAVREAAFSEAERLLEQHAFERRLRTLDAIQVAVGPGRLCGSHPRTSVMPGDQELQAALKTAV